MSSNSEQYSYAQQDRPWVIASPIDLDTSSIIPIPKTPNRRLTYHERVEIHILSRIAGWSNNQIATAIGIPYRTIARYVNEPATPIKGKGRKPILDTPSQR
jgi:hypothetical protein